LVFQYDGGTFTLFLYQQRTHKHITEGRRAMRDRHQPIRVLLVDDSVTLLDSVTRFLANEPRIQISGRALLGSEAIQQAQRLQPDVVLMDVAIPGMNGLEVTRQIKAQPHAPCVIIVTMNDEVEYRTAAHEVGADGFVPKLRCRTHLLPLIAELVP